MVVAAEAGRWATALSRCPELKLATEGEQDWVECPQVRLGLEAVESAHSVYGIAGDRAVQLCGLQRSQTRAASDLMGRPRSSCRRPVANQRLLRAALRCRSNPLIPWPSPSPFFGPADCVLLLLRRRLPAVAGLPRVQRQEGAAAGLAGRGAGAAAGGGGRGG